MNTAEYIVKRLEELGVNEFFGIPGDYNFNILYAVENNSNVNWVGCTNELNAGYAADGYARIRGYGALITTYGVGELSAVNAIAGSMAENVPVVHIVGLPSTKNIENKTLIHHNFQDVNYDNFINAYKSVTAATTLLTRDNAKLEIDRILKILVKEKKPVYIAIPEDIALTEISDRVVSYDWTSDKENLEKAADLISQKINSSEKPVIIGDVLVKRFDSRIEYKEFVTKTQIPVSALIMGTNLIDMNYEKYMGLYLGEYRNPIAQKYIEETDCLIAIGLIRSDLNCLGKSIPYDINKHIAIYGNYAYIEGKRYDNIKMSELLEAITQKVEPKNIDVIKPNQGLKIFEPNGEELSSSYIYPRIQEFIKENDIIFAETGMIPFGVSQMCLPASAELQTQTLWGSIGWATPAVLGASLAKPQAKVILITGEGAHQQTAMEIGTMLRYGVKPIIIVINNKGYTTERFLSNNPQDKINDIVQMNYSKFARVFEGDIWSTKVTTSEDFDKALKVTQIMNKLCYIEVCTDVLDAPQLVLELIKNLNTEKEIEKPLQPVSADKSRFNEVKLSTSAEFDYETVVHKAIVTDIDEEEKFDG